MWNRNKQSFVRLAWRFPVTLVVLVCLFGHDLALALPQARSHAEPALAPDSLISPGPIAVGELEVAPATALPAAAAAIPDARALPADVAGLTERVDLRTADSATFEAGEDRYVTILDAGVMHYKDSQGAWQIIDPAFRPTENGFVVERNSIHSRAGFSAARLSIAVGDTAIAWQAVTLGAGMENTDDFIPLAEALAEPSTFAEKQDADRVLHYAGHWSDPTLVEEIVSAPDSLEHLLILAAPPQADGTPDFLELRATLTLWPGAELWADGQSRSTAFQTTGGLEIRDAEGNVALVFDPILTFEQRQPSVTVDGVYVARPAGKPNAWTIGLRTPWSWWTDPARQYPAVLDPTMRVLQPTGYGNGIAWVGNGYPGNPDTPDKALKFGGMVLGSWVGSGQYNGYVQFNSIPFMLTNAPVAVTAAYLDVEPAYGRMPYYYCKGEEGECIDWDMFPVQHNATLYDLGQCPGDCGGFSLVSEPKGFSWTNVPTGTAIGTLPLSAPPPATGGQTTVTSWDVTNAVRTWNQQSPRPADGPAFRLTVPSACPTDYFVGVNEHLNIPYCTRLVIHPTGARLRIEYTELPIAIGQSFLNSPGVPSFYEGVFEDTNHQYDLAMPGSEDHWRAVAVRGNHAIAPALPTRTGLKLVDHSGSEPVNLANGVVQEADKTAFVLIDDINPYNFIESADLLAEVAASNENDFPADEGRNYRIEYQQATPWDVGYSAWVTKTLSFQTGRLIKLGEFELETGDSVTIRVTAPVTFPLELGLAAPTRSSDEADSALGNANLDKSFGPEGFPVRSKEFQYVQTPGTWALAMINQGRPIDYPRDPEGGMPLPVTVEILRCPKGTIATAKWKCQPVILPDGDTPSRTVSGLTIYSEGGFTGSASDSVWCTKDEGNGTPIIGAAVNGRRVAVGQGSVCRNGAVISTTADSGVGLVIVDPTLNPAPDGTTRGKIVPAFVYGSVALYPLPAGYPTGVVLRTGTSTQLAPAEDVRRNFAPFEEYWSDVFTAAPDWISTEDMKAHGGGEIVAPVTVDAAAPPTTLTWDVPWTLYPDEATLYDYVFEVQPDQSPALPSPTSLASLQLRILGSGGEATGLVETLDCYKFESSLNAGQFQAGKAKVTQDKDLGGATKNAVVVIQPPGMTRLPANVKSCSDDGAATSCLDLHRDDYVWENGDGDKNVQLWELPDIHIVDSAGLIMFNRPGDLQIFSADHPYAKTDVEQSFSFDTWGATVSIKEEACTPGGPVVTVVKGSASIAIPSVGDDGSGGSPSVQVNFKLCQAKLYQAQLILELPPAGIPIASSGMGVYLIGGTITIDPDFTQIELQIGFQSLDGVTLSDGIGSVLIDTRGLFQLQASATIVSMLDADLLLQIAWNPLDVLLEAGVTCCGGLITGGLHMHAWLGQGWQHKYSWLPDNDAFHFCGSIEASLNIPEGYIADLGFMELPPFDFSIGIRIAFGEFCTNANCTEYDWGMSAALTIFGFDIGVYVDSSGPELILGSDDHVLIDQFGPSVQQRAAQAYEITGPPPPPGSEIIQPGNWQPFLVKSLKTPVDDWPIESASAHGCTGVGTSIHTCPFTVSAGAGRALFTVGWENGDLDVALIRPDDTIITATNAMTYGIVFSQTNSLLMKQVSFGVPAAAIMAGNWRLRLSNVITDPPPAFQTNYQLLFAAEPPPPTLTWSMPVDTGTLPDSGGLVTLEWKALRGGQPLTVGTKIELFYVPVAGKPITPTVFTGTLITNQAAASDGEFVWDTGGLASGEYAVGGRIDDHFNANGHIVAWAPGTITINDTTPPPPPDVYPPIDDKDALIVLWVRDNTTLDLAGYLVEYTIPQWNETAPQLPKVRRVLPSSPDKWPWLEHIRLGGLLSGLPTEVCVRAYDASGNVSGCKNFTHTISFEPANTLGAPQRVNAQGGRNPLNGQTYLRVNWEPPAPGTGTPASYALSYQVAGCVLPGADSLADQGPSPIDVGDTRVYTLTGLTIGQTYRIAVNGFSANGYGGPETVVYAMFIDPTDTEGDGLADQWADLYDLTGGAEGDPDKDGVNNLEEYTLKSHPLHADSDGDGYYDGEESDWGTDVCGPEHPPYHTKPKLTLAGRANLAFAVASNQRSTKTQNIRILNFGGGTLEWSASASAPWITLGSESGSGMFSLPIGVNPSGLSTGRYTGTVTIVSLAAVSGTLHSLTTYAQEIEEAATIEVELKVLPPKDLRYVFLPLVLRSYNP